MTRQSLLQAGLYVALSGPGLAQTPAPGWRQFDFQDGQQFSYLLRVEQARRTAFIPADIELESPDGRALAAWIRTGRIGQEQEVTVNFPRNQPGPLLDGGWAQTPNQKMLQAMVLSRLPELEGRELTPGSRWNIPGAGGTGTAVVLGGCSEAGIRGMAVEVSGNTARGPVQLIACLASGVPLPLSMTMRSAKEGLTTEARLQRYQPAPQARTAPSDRALDGLYLGTHAPDVDGVQVQAYIFRPSGRLVQGSRIFLDPDAIRRVGSPGAGPDSWRLADRFPREDPLARTRQVVLDFSCHLGTYVLGEGGIRVRTRRVQVDVTHRTVYYEGSIGPGPADYEETYPFRRVKGGEVIEIRGGTLLHQGDFTGRRLEAVKMESVVLNLPAQSRMVQGWFRPDGTFLLKRFRSGSSVGGLILGPAESENRGRYEIRGHEILFYSPDGQVERNLFGYLGKGTQGKEIVVIGNDICPVDRIF